MSETKSSEAKSSPSKPKRVPVKTPGAAGPEPAGSNAPAGEVGAAGGAAPTPSGETSPSIRVTAKTDGFRRAGRAWPASGDVVLVADLSEAQLLALRSDPSLIVQDL